MDCSADGRSVDPSLAVHNIQDLLLDFHNRPVERWVAHRVGFVGMVPHRVVFADMAVREFVDL